MIEGIEGIEILLLPIVAFLVFVVYTKSRVLVEFRGSILEKALMVVIVIGAACRNQLYGIIAATAMVVILENNYEGFDVADISKLLSVNESKGVGDDTTTDSEEVVSEDAEEVVSEEVVAEDAEEVVSEDAEEVVSEEVVSEDAEEVVAEDDAEKDVVNDGFIGSMLSNIGITSSNERIDRERTLQQGKCSNEEFTKIY